MRKHHDVVCWTLGAALTCCLLAVFGPSPAPCAETTGIDVSYVTPNAVATVIAHPKRVLNSPEITQALTATAAATGMTKDVMKAQAKKSLGFDPFEVEQVMVIVEPQMGPPQVAVILRLGEAVKGPVLPDLWKKTSEDQLDGKTYRKAKQPDDPSIFQPDDHTIIVGHDELVKQAWANRANPKEGTMSRVLGHVENAPDAMAIVLIEPIRPMIAAPLAMAPMPPQLADVKKLPELLTSIGVKANIVTDTGLTFSLKATDEAAAEELEGILNKLLDMARQALAAQAANAGGGDPGAQMQAQIAKQINDNVLKSLKPERKGKVVTLALHANGGAAAAATTTALLLPAVQAAREAARRTNSMNQMKQIGIAMHNYAMANKTLPPAYKADASGKPLLSWRVLILPYLGREDLYKKFNLDEPWDSDNNKKLIAEMPSMCANPNSGVSHEGKTNYLTIRGEKAMFSGAKGVSFADVKDGLSNTIMTVEVPDASAVIWTKPDDFTVDESDPIKGLVGMRPMGFLAGFGDGSVRMIAASLDPTTLKALFTRDGGEAVKLP
jgi:hypothetical protein